jgi:hypothetical protein
MCGCCSAIPMPTRSASLIKGCRSCIADPSTCASESTLPGQTWSTSYAQRRFRGVSTFVPKPHTPFQWVGQERRETILRHQEILRRESRMQGLKLSWSEYDASHIEALLSRGDRRLSDVIERAWSLGARFDGWREAFRYDLWLQALEEHGLDLEWYFQRSRSRDEVLPWSHIDAGVSTGFLWSEWQRSIQSGMTDDCRYGKCVRCGTDPRACGDAHRIRKTIRLELRREREVQPTSAEGSPMR